MKPEKDRRIKTNNTFVDPNTLYTLVKDTPVRIGDLSLPDINHPYRQFSGILLRSSVPTRAKSNPNKALVTRNGTKNVWLPKGEDKKVFLEVDLGCNRVVSQFPSLPFVLLTIVLPSGHWRVLSFTPSPNLSLPHS